MKKVFKCALLWMTFISVIMLIMAADSINFMAWVLLLIMNIVLVWACSKILSYSELYKYSGSAYFENLLKKSK